MVAVAAIVLVGLAIAALLYWGTRSTPNDPSPLGFDPITGVGGGAVDFIDPQRGIIGPSDEDIERFGGSSVD